MLYDKHKTVVSWILCLSTLSLFLGHVSNVFKTTQDIVQNIFKESHTNGADGKNEDKQEQNMEKIHLWHTYECMRDPYMHPYSS